MQEIVNQIEQKMNDLDAQINSHPYAATVEDYAMVDGVQLYKDEFIDNMPSDYAMLLGQYGALSEARNMMAKDIIKNDLQDHLKSSYPEKYQNRWEISFDE